MARKIAILGSREHMKKSIALLLIRRGMAYWVEQNQMIARLDAATTVPLDLKREHVTTFIPAKLPPAEIPNTRFRPSEQMLRSRLGSDVAILRHIPRLEQQQYLSL